MTEEDPYGFPQELCCRPLPHIGLSGLDTVKNPTHRYIWDAFCKNLNHLPLVLNVISPNHQFPVVKQKKPTFDRYIPNGILKKNWLKKHLTEIPPVVAVFLDSNWDDPRWETICVQQVQAVKSKLGGLGTKLAVILIQKVAPLPSAEDGRGAERAAMLCSACDLPSKQLYVIPQDDHLQGYVARLLNAFFDLAKAYYGSEIKLVSNHKDHLSKIDHRYLLVRHNFKIGFLSELKQDDRGARSSYELAYKNIKEVRSSDSNIQELKVVAGFISYKLCSLMFRLGEPRDALNQFKSHIKLYKSWLEPKQLMFEHYAWLAAQYAAFADLFDEAIKQGLSAMQTEHPGIYYHQAALYTMNRKEVARELSSAIRTISNLALVDVEYWGQRGWRQGKLTDTDAEKNGIRALQEREIQFDHSARIIAFLGNSISQFKTYRCPRMRLQLLVQMAEEYHSAGTHGKALTLLTHMLSDYRTEMWWHLLSALLRLGLSSSFLSANVQDYVTFALEALSPHIPIPDERKLAIFQNLLAILEGETPTPQPGSTDAENSQALLLWAAAPIGDLMVIDMSKVRMCLAVHARFTDPSVEIGEPISLRIYLKSFCPGAIKISSVTVTLSSENILEDIEATSKDVILERDAMGVFECSAVSQLDAGHYVRVDVINVRFNNKRPVLLKLAPLAPSTIVPPELRSKPIADHWETQGGYDMTRIACPKVDAKMKIRHYSPALLGEQFPVDIAVANLETFSLYNAVLEVKLLAPGDESSPDASTRLSDEGQTSISPRSIKVLLETISQGCISRARIFLKGYSTGDRTLGFTLTYSKSLSTPNKMASAIEQQTTIAVVQPFEISLECLTTKFEPTSNCYAHETFLLRCDVLVSSPCPITIHHSTLELGLLVANECQKLSSQLAGVTLYPGETGRDIFPLKLTEAKAQPVAVGTYVIQWSREGSDIITSSSITLPAVRCLPTMLSVSMSLPAHGRVRTPMPVVYTLFNRTSTLLQFDMHIESSEAFMFAGQRQALLRLLPESEHKLYYNLYPLLSGLLALPRLVLTAPDFSDQLSNLLERNLPSHVYVMPQEKDVTSAIL